MTKIKEGYKDTEIGVIPVEWDAVRLEDIVKKLQSGGTPLSTNPNFYDGDIPFVKIDDITRSGKYLVDTKISITQNGLDNSSAWLVPINSILYSMYASIGFLSINKVEVSTNQAIMNIIPDGSKITLEFLYQYLLDLKGKIDKFIDQTTQKNLNAQKVKNFKIPLPPLKEQEKIADILGAADRKTEAIAKRIEKAQTLKIGLLQKLLSEGINHCEFKDSELGKIPESWEVVRLKTCSKLIKDGTHGTHKNVENGIPLLSAKDIQNGKVRLDTDSRNISLDDFNKIHKNYSLMDDDLLLTVVGTLGRVALIKDYNNNYTFQRSVAIIRLLSTNCSKYFYHIFNSVFFQKQLILHSNASAQAGIYLGELEKLKIPLPPLKEQKQIAEILSTADEKLEVLRAKKQKYETLKIGLLQKLLSGEVRTV